MNPIATLFALIAAAMLTPLLAAAIHRDNAMAIDAVTAQQLRTVSAAVSSYMQLNAASLQTTLAQIPAVSLCVPGPGQVCPDPNLDLSAGYLPPGTAGVNPFQQTWSVVVTLNAGFLQALVLSSGGEAMATVDAETIARQVGAGGGVTGGGVGVESTPACPAAFACGVFGAWGPLAIGNASAYPDPGPGHLAALLSFGLSGLLHASQLARISIPGHPELNAMQADLNMADASGHAHDIDNVGQLGASSLSAQSELVLGTAAGAMPRGTCAPNGQLAANQDGSGQILDCQYGTWQPLGGHAQLVASYSVQDWRLSRTNNPVPAPACPSGGSASIAVTPQNFSVDATAGVRFGTTGAGPWNVYIQDGAGNPIPAATALVTTYCAF